MSAEQRSRLQKAYGYTYEEYKTMILPMALNGLRRYPLWEPTVRWRS